VTVIYIGSNLFINLPPMQQSNLLNLYLNYLPIPLSKIIWSNPLNLSRLLFCTCLFVGNMRTNGSSFFLFRSYRNTSSLAAPRQASSNNAASEATHLIAQHPPPRPALSNYRVATSVAAAIELHLLLLLHLRPCSPLTDVSCVANKMHVLRRTWVKWQFS